MFYRVTEEMTTETGFSVRGESQTRRRQYRRETSVQSSRIFTIVRKIKMNAHNKARMQTEYLTWHDVLCGEAGGIGPCCPDSLV